MEQSKKPRRMLLKFESDEDIISFRNKCHCYENYYKKATHTLVGTFTEFQLFTAANKFHAMVSFEPELNEMKRQLNSPPKGLRNHIKKLLV